jgi:hypothetical protein
MVKGKGVNYCRKKKEATWWRINIIVITITLSMKDGFIKRA